MVLSSQEVYSLDRFKGSPVYSIETVKALSGLMHNLSLPGDKHNISQYTTQH